MDPNELDNYLIHHRRRYLQNSVPFSSIQQKSNRNTEPTDIDDLMIAYNRNQWRGVVPETCLGRESSMQRFQRQYTFDRK